MKELLSIKDIKQDIALQPRAKMDSVIIAEYAESIKSGDTFPPLTVYNVGGEFYLVDGYHRLMALKSAKITKAEVEVTTGTMREALLFSVGVNAKHGIRRTNDDKNRAVMILLRDPEWKDWSNAAIAKACNVSVDLVAKTRDSILGETDRYRTDTPEPTPEKRKVKRGGKVFTMDTSKIGKKEPPKKLAPEQCFSPQPGSIPVTDAPPQPSLSEQMKEPEACTSPPAPAEPTKPLPGSWINTPPRNLEEIKKAEREQLEETAESLLELLPKSTQLIVTDLLREHPSWKVKDAFYFGIQCLAQKVVRK